MSLSNIWRDRLTRTIENFNNWTDHVYVKEIAHPDGSVITFALRGVPICDDKLAPQKVLRTEDGFNRYSCDVCLLKLIKAPWWFQNDIVFRQQVDALSRANKLSMEKATDQLILQLKRMKP